MIPERVQDKYFTNEPKFKIGDLTVLIKDGSFLERKWMFDPLYMSKTIRPHDYLFVNKNTICVVLDVQEVVYEVLILTDDLLFKSLVIFIATFDRTAELLNDIASV